MAKYEIKLKPMGAFYFGGEKYRNSNNKEDANYNLKSLLYPQQTAILGMLRKELLQINGYYRENYLDYLKNYDIHKKAIDNLIGKTNFLFSECNQDFGCIKNLSPIFLSNNNNGKVSYIFEKPKDLLAIGKKYEVNRDTKNGNVYLNEYNPKKNQENQLIEIIKEDDKYTPRNILKYEDIFISQEQVRIYKTKDGKTEDESYFKQKYYRMDKGYTFMFFADIDDSIELKNSFVHLGGNNSIFKMEVKKSSLDMGLIVSELANKDKIIVISPTFIMRDKVENYYAITETISFRNLENYSGKFKKHETKKQFLDRGSVLFVDNKDSVMNEIGLNENLKKIGYNYCI